MGYFDTLSSSAFKTKDDGQKLFFPWGTLGHGYIIPSDAEFERLQYRYKNVTVFSILVGIAAIIFLTESPEYRCLLVRFHCRVYGMGTVPVSQPEFNTREADS